MKVRGGQLGPGRHPQIAAAAFRASTVTQREAVELLRAAVEGVALMRVRGDRLEATSLRHAWAPTGR